MTPLALLLVSGSVAIHVGWNWAGKRQRPSAGFMLLANTLGGALLVPVLALDSVRPADVPAPVWATLVATGFFQALYCAALAGAYRVGDLSIAYPIARSLPPVLVLAAAVILGRADRVGVGCAAGIGLVVLGGLLLPLARFTELRWARYARAGCGLAALAAVGTAGYSLLDDHGLRLLRELPPVPFSPAEATLTYLPLEAWLTSVWLGLWVALVPSERGAFAETLRGARRPALVVGIGMYTSYVLALGAMSFVRDVSYVVGFRQLSVPLAAAVGIVFLGEARTLPKLAGTALMALGVSLVALG